MAVIVRYAEIALKGKNRAVFERQLVRNIKDCLKRNSVQFDSVVRMTGRIVVWTADDCLCLRNVFGIANFSKAVKVDVDLEKIKDEALRQYTGGTFRITSNRIDKVLMNSDDINKEVGAYVVDKTGAKVSLKNPDVNICVEVCESFAMVYSAKVEGAKGLPVGVEGTVAVLMEDKDSVLAAKLMMKRGCNIVLVKVNDIDYSELENYSYGFTIKVFDSIPDKVSAVVTSEKLESLKERNLEKPVLRPLIAS